MLLAICTTRVKKKLKQNNKNKVPKNLLQGDSNPAGQNQLKLNVNASMHWTTPVDADSSSLKR